MLQESVEMEVIENFHINNNVLSEKEQENLDKAWSLQFIDDKLSDYDD